MQIPALVLLATLLLLQARMLLALLANTVAEMMDAWDAREGLHARVPWEFILAHVLVWRDTSLQCFGFHVH